MRECRRDEEEAEAFGLCDGVEGRRLEAVGPCEAVAMASETDVDADRRILCDIVEGAECDAESEMVRVKNGLGIPSKA